MVPAASVRIALKSDSSLPCSPASAESSELSKLVLSDTDEDISELARVFLPVGVRADFLSDTGDEDERMGPSGRSSPAAGVVASFRRVC